MIFDTIRQQLFYQLILVQIPVCCFYVAWTKNKCFFYKKLFGIQIVWNFYQEEAKIQVS